MMCGGFSPHCVFEDGVLHDVPFHVGEITQGSINMYSRSPLCGYFFILSFCIFLLYSVGENTQERRYVIVTLVLPSVFFLVLFVEQLYVSSCRGDYTG